MPGPLAFLQSRATVRGIVVSALMTAALILICKFVLIPRYSQLIGFAPFDVQSPLSHFMVAVEMGTIEKGEATNAYILFAGVDSVRAAAAAWLFAVFWAWLFAAAPNRAFAFLTRGGVLLVPFYILILDAIAKIGFLRIISGLENPAYDAAIDFSVTAHRLHFALMDLRNYATAAFVALAGIMFVLRRWRP